MTIATILFYMPLRIFLGLIPLPLLGVITFLTQTYFLLVQAVKS